MVKLEQLIERIIGRVNINLRESSFDVGPYVRDAISRDRFSRFYGFYGITQHHPLHFYFNHSNVAGSYFLGKCTVDHSIVYKTDVRGDELKSRGHVFSHKGKSVTLNDDEMIRVKDSFLVKNLVHSSSHVPESAEEFLIESTVSMHYANIHGSPVEGCFIGPFATVDLTSVHDCVVGHFAYVQTGELSHRCIEPGQIWVQAPGVFDFQYRFPATVLRRYVQMTPGQSPQGIFFEFVEGRKQDFEKVFEVVASKPPIAVPERAALSRYAVVKGETRINENVLVAQRAYLEDAWLGPGSNAQENCYIIHSRLEGNDVTAHGGKVIHAMLGRKVFVGFNAFLRGNPDCRLSVGGGSIVMPHTIIDLDESLEIPARHLVWGYIRSRKDLEGHSIALDELARVEGSLEIGEMRFEGSGAQFVHAFEHRIEHILEANGAFFDGDRSSGHAQKGQNISFNIIQPYPEGAMKGLYPTIDIRP